MNRRIFVLVVACVLVGSLLGGAMRARAAGSSDKPTLKVIVVLKAGANAGEVVGKLARGHAAGVYRYRYFSAVAATVSQSTLQALQSDGNVQSVVADHKVRAPKVPGVRLRTITGAAGAASAGAAAPLESEALQLTHAQDAWSIKVDGRRVMGQGIRVGLLDTGTDPTHPDLAAAIGGYRDFTGDGLEDNDGHGTGTSSCVAAQGLPVRNPITGTTMRVAGMAPRAKVIMAKVIDVEGGWDSNIMRGIEWLIEQKVDIISCSLGSTFIPPSGLDPSSLALQAAIDHGITVVNSEGNEGPGQGTEGSAPDLKNVIAVGATTGWRAYKQLGYLVHGNRYRGDQVITWTSRGPNARGDFRPDIMGLGAWGWALAPVVGDAQQDQNVRIFGGTSMACPVVAGDLALAESAWKMKHPGRRLPAPSYWKTLLASTATDLGYPALDQSSGLVNAAAAVREVLRQGKSFLASVAADPRNPSSWSARVTGGARATTTIAVRNTGARTELVTLRPSTFTTLKTITHAPITLTGPAYKDVVKFTVPAGADLVQARVTWPSDPAVSIESTVYDSVGDFVSYGETDGGYGHLSFDQVALHGPAGQRPAVVRHKPWSIAIGPTGGMEPSAPQTVYLSISFLHRVRATAIVLSRKSLTIRPGAVARVRATVTAPRAAGTWFNGIVVSNGASTTTIPVAVRVPVKLTNGHGTFSGTIKGSSIEYSGGEFYFYDVKVPAGTRSITASLHWPHAGNLVDLYLIDPSGDLRDAKGGDLLWYPDYSGFGVPGTAFGHTSEQVIWDAPRAGTWQVLVWAAGFDGTSSVEPYSGSISLDAPVVAPATWTGTAPPGGQATADFTVENAGTTTLSAYAESQATGSDGSGLYGDVALAPVTGTLTSDPQAVLPLNGLSPTLYFTLPQNVALVTATATWTGPETLVDIGLYDPSQTDKADGLATTSQGNAVAVADPMAGLWTLILGYGNPTLPAPDAQYTVTVEYRAPTAIAGFASSATAETPLVISPGSGTIHVTIDVPADAKDGDVITGMLHFSTTSDGTESEGGDHLGSVPVTITVGGP